jgi:hypothetical protein
MNPYHSRISFTVFLLAAFLLAGGSPKTVAEEISLPPSSATEWTQPFENPVIKAGDFRPQGLWNDPDIHKENGLYVMYMTSSVKSPFEAPILPFRAVSKDGRQWKLEPKNPVVTVQGTKYISIETPCVVRHNGLYHMFFTGEFASPPTKPNDYVIGHALSFNGIQWFVLPKPALVATGNVSDWNGFLVAEPGAVVFKNEIYLYFCATGARKEGEPQISQTIGCVRSRDGFNFSKPIQVLSQSDTYPASQGYAGYSTPAPFLLKGKVHLVYDVAHFKETQNPSWQQVALHHAVSKDGLTNFIQDDKPLFNRNDLKGTTGEIIGPTVLVDQKQIKLWFGGHVPITSEEFKQLITPVRL